MIRVKMELGIETPIVLSDSTDEDEFPDVSPFRKPSPSSDLPSFVTHSPSRREQTNPLPLASSLPTSILQCLLKLASMPGRKNILKKLDYNKLKILEVNYLLL